MIGYIIGFAIAIGAVALGLKGFSAAGLPLTGKKNITGKPARVVGVVCIVFGILLLILQMVILILSAMRGNLRF